MSEEGTVRVGVIGCGLIAKRHIGWLQARPECRIATLCDVLPEAARALAEEVTGEPPAIVQDHQEVVQDPGIDAVVVLLPHHLHHPVALAALEAGKHVLIEKPMTTSVQEARELADACRRTGRSIVVGYQRAYLPEYLHARDLIAAGDLGPIRLLSGHLEQAWYRLVAGRGPDDWRAGPARSGGGQLTDAGSHTLAALLHVTDLQPVEVYAQVDHCGMAVDVNAALVIRFAEGQLAAVAIGGFGHSITESVRVVGERHSAQLFWRTIAHRRLIIDGEEVDTSSVTASDPASNLIDVALGRDHPWAGVELGLRVAQVTQAAYLSARERAPVPVDSL